MSLSRILTILWLPICAGFALLLTLEVTAERPEASGILWEPVATVFGGSLGYALVLVRRPRRLRGGMYFVIAGTGSLGAAVWALWVVADVGPSLLLFIAAGANLAGGLLSDDALGGVLRRRMLRLFSHPMWRGHDKAGAIYPRRVLRWTGATQWAVHARLVMYLHLRESTSDEHYNATVSLNEGITTAAATACSYPAGLSRGEGCLTEARAAPWKASSAARKVVNMRQLAEQEWRDEGRSKRVSDVRLQAPETSRI